MEQRECGASYMLTMKCAANHLFSEWSSSPKHANGTGNEIFAINLLSASAILVSDNNYRKIQLMMQFMHLQMISPSTFTRHQRLYICQGITHMWGMMQSKVLQHLHSRREPTVILAGTLLLWS